VGEDPGAGALCLAGEQEQREGERAVRSKAARAVRAAGLLQKPEKRI